MTGETGAVTVPRFRVETVPDQEAAILACLRSGQLATGDDVRAFEAELAHRLGVQHCVTLANGFSALVVAQRALGLTGVEVAVPALNTCWAVTNAVRAAGNRPVPVDCDEWGRITAQTLQTARANGVSPWAVIAVDFFGISSTARALEALGVTVIQDAAQSILTSLKQRSVASAATLSFYPTKMLSAIDGGAVCLASPEHDAKARQVRYYADQREDEAGTGRLNVRLPNLNACAGRAALAKIDDVRARMITLASRLDQAVEGFDFVRPLATSEFGEVRQTYVVSLPCEHDRDELAERLRARGIGAGSVFFMTVPPGEAHGKHSLANNLVTTTLSLPMFPAMTDDEALRVEETVDQTLRGLARAGG